MELRTFLGIASQDLFDRLFPETAKYIKRQGNSFDHT